MDNFTLHAEVDALLASDDVSLAYATSKCVAELRARSLFNRTYNTLVTAIANNAIKNAALKAAGLPTGADKEQA